MHTQDNNTEHIATETLGIISLQDQLRDWELQTHSKTVLAITRTPKTARDKDIKQRIAQRGENYYRQKCPLLPKKIQFKDQSLTIQVEPRPCKSYAQSRRKLGPRKISNSISSPIQHESKCSSLREIENIDLMKYWLRHRSQSNAMTALIQKLKAKRKSMRAILI